MREIHLHGNLQGRFGGPFLLDVRDPAEAIRALCSQLDGFQKAINDGTWHVQRGELSAEKFIDEQGLDVSLGQANQLHILPALSGGKGVGKAILGVAMIGAAFFTGGLSLAGNVAFGISASTMAIAGAALAITGISTMLSPMPGTDDYGSQTNVAERPSFLFDGPVNNAAQGLAVPLIYGEVNTGSVVISAGMSVEQLPGEQ